MYRCEECGCEVHIGWYLTGPTDPRGNRGVFCSVDCISEWAGKACNLGVPRWKDPGDTPYGETDDP